MTTVCPDRIARRGGSWFLAIQGGGNRQIFAGNVNGLKIAVKKTSYRSKEYTGMDIILVYSV